VLNPYSPPRVAYRFLDNSFRLLTIALCTTLRNALHNVHKSFEEPFVGCTTRRDSTVLDMYTRARLRDSRRVRPSSGYNTLSPSQMIKARIILSSRWAECCCLSNRRICSPATLRSSMVLRHRLVIIQLWDVEMLIGKLIAIAIVAAT
jgi:hypothetical protein